jgi:hypothetical protein
LDFLAADLAEHDFDLKSTIRLIVSSQAYQSQAVALDAQPSSADYVYSGPIAKRMTAEQFVDALWQITETGPNEPTKNVAAFLTDEEKASHKTYRAAMVASDLLMRSLGRPNREQVVSDRPAMLTTLQALDLSNSPLLAKTLSRGAANVVKKFEGQDLTAVVGWLFQCCLSRPPSAQERATAMELLSSPSKQSGVEDLLWSVFMLPEFQIIR